MSVAIHIAFYESGEKLKSVNIGPEDREIEAMLLNSGSIIGLGIEYDTKGLLTEEEEQMMKFYEINELISDTKILSPKLVLKIFNKINFRVKKKFFSIYTEMLNAIDSLDLSQEEKDRRKKSLLEEYDDFDYQRYKLIGVLETAIAFNYDIKITSNFY